MQSQPSSGKNPVLKFLRPTPPPVAKIQEYFLDSEAESRYSNGGPCHELLTQRIENFLGGRVFARPVSSGTVGLMLGLKALLTAEPQRRQVLLPSFTFPALIGAVEWIGLEPVFIDIDPNSWHVDSTRLEQALRQHSRNIGAVVAASTFGVAPEWEVSEAWRVKCQEYEVPLIVDSAAGFGSSDASGRMLGCQGDLEVFSFHATKTFCVGEGGLVTSKQSHTCERVARLSNFGLNEERVVNIQSGINGKMSEWTAATALARLDSFKSIMAERQHYAKKVTDKANVAGFSSQPNLETSSVQFIPLLAPSESEKRDLLARADEIGVETMTYFDPPLHRMGAFATLDSAGPLDVTEKVSRRVVSLPMADHLREEELQMMIHLFDY